MKEEGQSEEGDNKAGELWGLEVHPSRPPSVPVVFGESILFYFLDLPRSGQRKGVGWVEPVEFIYADAPACSLPPCSLLCLIGHSIPHMLCDIYVYVLCRAFYHDGGPQRV